MKRQPEIKRDRDIEALRVAGRIARLALDGARAMVRPGVSTADIDAEVERIIRAHGATPEFKGYHGYPASSCISVNEQVVHGIPGPRRLKEGDIVGIDVGARIQGFVGDNAATIPVGKVRPEAQRLIDTTRECLELAIAQCVPGKRLSDIGRAVQSHAEARGYGVVRDYAGHGIGRQMHEEPNVPNYVDEHTVHYDRILEPGLCIAIEPMLNLGGRETRVLSDKWTVVTKDGSLSAHWEDSVAVTKDGPLILTRA